MFLITKVSKNDKQIEHKKEEDEGEAMAIKILWERDNFKVKIEEDGKLIYETGR